MSATPAASALAKELGVEIGLLSGTGKDGKITVSDVRNAVDSAPDLSVVAAVERDLADLALRDAGLARSSLAAAALVLAGELDNAKNSATSKSMCARSLIDTLDRLQELAPPKQEGDSVDELSSRRAARLAGGART